MAPIARKSVCKWATETISCQDLMKQTLPLELQATHHARPPESLILAVTTTPLRPKTIILSQPSSQATALSVTAQSIDTSMPRAHRAETPYIPNFLVRVLSTFLFSSTSCIVSAMTDRKDSFSAQCISDDEESSIAGLLGGAALTRRERRRSTRTKKAFRLYLVLIHLVLLAFILIDARWGYLHLRASPELLQGSTWCT